MSYGASDKDVVGGKTPLRLSPVKGLTNATAILANPITRGKLDRAMADGGGGKGDGFASFARFAKHFTKNPTEKQLSKAAGIFASGGGGI
jgi:hypothetical protein